MARHSIPPARSRRRRLGSAATLACAVAVLAGCGHPQEVLQSGTVGTNAQIGAILLRNVYVENPMRNGYRSAGDATVRLTLINQADRPDTLTAVTSDVATRVEILLGSGCQSTQHTVASLELPARVDVSSPPNRPGPTEAAYALRLVDLRVGILQGATVPISFRFARAGTITLPTPVEAATQPSAPCSSS
jgi:copper(I)-binding protein